MPQQHAVILFDGVCNLCNGFVQFVIRQDGGHRFRFASLQSEAARQLLKELPASGRQTESVILIENGRYYQQSAAALRILRHLGGAWALLYGFMILPPFLRDSLYAWVARNRYRWFGRRQSCMLPTPELQARFL
jgi:predicted DCC family thiol-disulfide oxidoreductase YuxK